MRPHTPEQVAAMKSFADSQPSGAERKKYALNNLDVEYSTVDMGDKKPFDYAVAAFVVPREDGQPISDVPYEIAVSNDVPEELQGIWAWHELHDFAELGHEAEDRCLTSEQVLAANMFSDPELYQQYIAVRILFYESLAEFIVNDFKEKGPESIYSLADLNGCQDALAFLQAKTTEPSSELVTKSTDSAALSLLDGKSTSTQPKIVPQSTKSSLFDAAMMRRAELDEQARQKAKQEVADAEKKRSEQEIEDERLAPERALSHKHAMEFIELMRNNGHDAKTQVYVRGTQVTGQTLRGPSTSVIRTPLGIGWEVKTRQYIRKDSYDYSGSVGEWIPGIILLDNGKAYNIAAFKDTPDGEVHVFSDSVDARTATPLDRPFATDEGHQILVDYIAERTNIKIEGSIQTEPSSTKKSS